MRLRNPLLFLFALLWAIAPALLPAITPEELQNRFKQLPTVSESELPPLPNEPTSFRGLIEHDGFEGSTWVEFPFVENPGSFGFDPQGRLFVAEANRFWLGVPDLRGANELIRDDFRAVTVEDRAKLYEKYASSFPEGWFTAVADRIIQLEDRDGNGAADHRTLFSDRFHETLDGIGFSVLADEGSVFFTCIPSLWKLTDTDNDGVADEEKVIADGFGVRVSFIGHDLHGIIRGPDGRLYFSVGDRGYHFTDAEGVVQEGSGRGAIFRCESDGSGLEVFCDGLRNPQELAFDDYGNLFTFDNTGDIGDLARMVYALEGTDSGWDMSHQSAHHYVSHLDWRDFHTEKSMWVAERMFDTWNEEQPQWVYPPASHVARGPSGVTYLTGESLPEDLRGKFLLANYRGPSENCTVLTVGIEPAGAGYVANSEDVLVKGVGASDVELGFDGNLYLCDFGGGWSVNENGSIQVMKPTDKALASAGAEVAALFKEGFDQRAEEELIGYLSHPDRRVRQSAQFALVKKGDLGREQLASVATSATDTIPRLHAIWGLGQFARLDGDVAPLLELLDDADAEIRANAVRVLGDSRAENARSAVQKALGDDSIRVRSLAAIALGRIADQGDSEAEKALFTAVRENGNEPDVVLRHALLSGLDRVANSESLANLAEAESREERLVALLTLRRRESPEVVRFLKDSDPLVVREAVRAIYDTAAVDSDAGDALAALGEKAATLPETLQLRVIAANYRRGGVDNARNLLALANDNRIGGSIRKAALIALKQWGEPINTDPVLGTYRPIPDSGDRSLTSLGEAVGGELKRFLGDPHDSDLTTLAMEFATAADVPLDPTTLLAQVRNTGLGGELRVAVLDSLSKANAPDLANVVRLLWEDDEPAVRAAALRHGFKLEINGVTDRAMKAVADGPPIVARAALAGLADSSIETVSELWMNREEKLRPDLHLDAFLLLQAAGDEATATFAAADPGNVHELTLFGGDAEKGKTVFENQGACLQCHAIAGNGGVQGPELSKVGFRLSRGKLLESLVDPGAEIATGYGMTTIALKNGDSVVGRLSAEAVDHVDVVGLDNQIKRVERSNIESIAPPVSAMPPLALSLPPKDLRDLVAYLASLKARERRGDASHGDDEKIAK